MMSAVTVSASPELRQLFGAYLNADLERAYGTVESALAAYRRETNEAHRTAARAELDRLLAEPGAPMRLDRAFGALGCEIALASPGAAWSLAATIRRALE